MPADVDTRAAIAESIIDYYGPRRGRAILDEVAARYKGPLTIGAFVNLTLREAARRLHGTTAGWDAASRAAGFDPAPYERTLALAPSPEGGPHGSRR